MIMFPKLKKRITSFLVGEEGKISKQSLLSLGAFLGVGVLGGVLAAKDASAQTHTNNLDLEYSGDAASATHDHHSSSVGCGMFIVRYYCGGSCGGSCGSCSCGCSCGSCSCGSCSCSCATSCGGV